MRIAPPRGFKRVCMPDRKLYRIAKELKEAGFFINAYWNIDEDEDGKYLSVVLEASKSLSLDNDVEIIEYVFYDTCFEDATVYVSIRNKHTGSVYASREVEVNVSEVMKAIEKLVEEVKAIDREEMKRIEKHLEEISKQLEAMGLKILSVEPRFKYVKAVHEKTEAIIEYKHGEGYSIYFKTLYTNNPKTIDASIIGLKTGEIVGLTIRGLKDTDLVKVIESIEKHLKILK